MPGRSTLTSLVLWFVPPRLQIGDPDTLRRAKLCVVYNLTVPLWGPGFAWLLWHFDEPAIATIIGLGTVCSIVPLFVLRQTGSLPLVGNLMAGLAAILIVGCAWLEGGVGAPGILWCPLVPMLAILLAGRRSGMAWTAGMVAVLVAFYLLDLIGIRVQFHLDGPRLTLLHLALATSVVVVLAMIAAIFERLKVEAMRSLEAANAALAAARDEAEAATRAKSDFLASMSHEIRTPIHGIFGMTELALDTTVDEERREFIQRARACAESLLNVINDILDFSRIEADRVVLEQAAFDPRAVLDGVLDTLSAEVGGKGLELIGCVDDAVPATLIGDPGRLRQVLVNLAGNAVKFTEAGEVVIRLAPAASAGDGAVDGAFILRGVVRDTGIGIAREDQARIFEAFAQADSSTTRRYGGTGLGLAITQRLVGLMGGSVDLKSEPGTGSRFGFTVRLAPGSPPPRPAQLEPPGLRVGVVDRNAPSRRHLSHLLGSWGCLVAAGSDPAFLQPADLEIIVVNLTSVDDVPALRRRLGGRRIPIVALVASATGRAGVPPDELAAVVSKPVKGLTLRAALSAARGYGEPRARRAAN